MGKRILLVDDDQMVVDMLKFYLKEKGHIVKSCRDGHRVMLELESGGFDLIILDITMPQLDGIEVLKKIRSQSDYKNLPILMLTSRNEREDVLITASYNIAGYILKPLKREDFLQRVERALQKTKSVAS
jgi:DNA-binding response OmpR family regulator